MSMKRKRSSLYSFVAMVILLSMVCSIAYADIPTLPSSSNLMTVYNTSEWVNWWTAVPRYDYRDTVTSSSTAAPNEQRYKKLYGPYYPAQVAPGTPPFIQESVKVSHAEEKVRNWVVGFESKYVTGEIGGSKTYTKTIEVTKNISSACASGTFVYQTRGGTKYTVTVKRVATYTDWARDANGNYLYDADGLIYERTVSSPSRSVTSSSNSYDYTYGSYVGT